MHFKYFFSSAFILAFSQGYGAESHHFVDQYKKTIPQIEQTESDNSCVKAKNITDYLCKFIPISKQISQIKEKDGLENKIATIIEGKKPLQLVLLRLSI